MALDRGYFADEGLDVTVEAGGPQVSVEPRLAAGRALVAQTYGLGAAAANANGAAIKIIATLLQRSPTVFASSADSPVRTPEDLRGLRIGTSDVARPVVEQFLDEIGVGVDEVTLVPTQQSLDPLAQGQVDTMVAYANETAALELAGFETELLYVSDYGYGDLTNAYGVTEQGLAENRERIVAFLRAEIRGCQDFVDDPETAARLTVEEYAPDAGLDLAEQEIAGRRFAEMVAYGDVAESQGLLRVSDEAKQQVIDVVSAAGTPTTAEELFDDTVLDEVYEGRTRL
jgi:NitT/TauT family transport system substrate-binding protein